MMRNTTLFLLVLVGLCTSSALAQSLPQIGPAIGPPPEPAAQAARPIFEWQEVTEQDSNGKDVKVVYARVSPDVYDRLLKTGLTATEGGVSTNPEIKDNNPGANVLRLGGKRYGFAGANGSIRDGDRTLWVLKFVPDPQNPGPDHGAGNGILPDPYRGVSKYRDQAGKALLFEVTGTAGTKIWGTDVYTDDTELGAAAVHAGLLAVGEKGIVKVTIVGGQEKYAGSVRNGITSGDWPKYEGSYRVELVRKVAH
jgi:hypothetical protein